MELTFDLCLPPEEASVPVVRHLCRTTLGDLGVDPECVFDIEVAVTEACTNVMKHARGSHDEYEVSVRVADHECEIRIRDRGGGFALDPTEDDVDDLAEEGRGVLLMRALVDRLDFISEPGAGTVVHLVKKTAVEERGTHRDRVSGKRGPRVLRRATGVL